MIPPPDFIGPLPLAHRCPTGDSPYTPCCNRSMFELPLRELISINPETVTCTGAPR